MNLEWMYGAVLIITSFCIIGFIVFIPYQLFISNKNKSIKLIPQIKQLLLISIFTGIFGYIAENLIKDIFIYGQFVSMKEINSHVSERAFNGDGQLSIEYSLKKGEVNKLIEKFESKEVYPKINDYESVPFKKNYLYKSEILRPIFMVDWGLSNLNLMKYKNTDHWIGYQKNGTENIRNFHVWILDVETEKIYYLNYDS